MWRWGERREQSLFKYLHMLRRVSLSLEMEVLALLVFSACYLGSLGRDSVPNFTHQVSAVVYVNESIDIHLVKKHIKTWAYDISDLQTRGAAAQFMVIHLETQSFPSCTLRQIYSNEME